METFPWWNEAHIKLSQDARKLADEVLIPMAERDSITKKFPWEETKHIASKGWFGTLIPKQYGGRLEDWGVTGAAIIIEEVSRAGLAGAPLTTTMFGAATQIVHNGNDEQKKKWLPRIARGA